MPYVIEQWRPPSQPDSPSGNVRVSRRAVGTLEEARRDAKGKVGLALLEYVVGYRDLVRQAESLPESGGVIDLPDGGRIEVRAKTNAELYEDLNVRTRILLVCDEDTDEVVAAWNAERPSAAFNAENDRGKSNV